MQNPRLPRASSGPFPGYRGLLRSNVHFPVCFNRPFLDYLDPPLPQAHSQLTMGGSKKRRLQHAMKVRNRMAPFFELSSYVLLICLFFEPPAASSRDGRGLWCETKSFFAEIPPSFFGAGPHRQPLFLAHHQPHRIHPLPPGPPPHRVYTSAKAISLQYSSPRHRFFGPTH